MLSYFGIYRDFLCEQSLLFSQAAKIFNQESKSNNFTVNEKVQFDNKKVQTLLALIDRNPPNSRRFSNTYPVLIIFYWFGSSATFSLKIKAKSENFCGRKFIIASLQKCFAGEDSEPLIVSESQDHREPLNKSVDMQCKFQQKKKKEIRRNFLQGRLESTEVIKHY